MNIIESMHDSALFRKWFGPTWRNWETFLKALFNLPMDEDDAIVYQRHTKRETAPMTPFKQAWVVVGRRGGKSLIAALVAVYLAVFRDYRQHLKHGEIGMISIIAADRRQARIILRYVKSFLGFPAMVKGLIANETADSVELSNNVTIEVQTASFRTTRGFTFLAVIAEEVSFWRSDESANPDTEIIAAVKPGLATVPTSLLLCISSPYARKGALWAAYSKHFGKDSPVLVWQAASREMNPTLDETVVNEALEEDPASASAEYMAEFRKDVEEFLNLEVIQACTVAGRFELAASGRHEYFGSCDPAGGSGSDSMTLAISHSVTENGATKALLDCIREVKPPFSPDAVTKEFADTLKSYGCSKVIGDRYAGEWVRESFREHGITYELADKNRSEIYGELLPALNSRRVELLDHKKLANQLVGLERRTGSSGRDIVDHSPGGHDDVANAAALALVLAGSRKKSAGLYF